jgi:hypothetical protein
MDSKQSKIATTKVAAHTCKEMEDYMNHGKTVHAKALAKTKPPKKDNFCTFVNGRLVTGTEGEIEYITRKYYNED